MRLFLGRASGGAERAKAAVPVEGSLGKVLNELLSEVWRASTVSYIEDQIVWMRDVCLTVMLEWCL